MSITKQEQQQQQQRVSSSKYVRSQISSQSQSINSINFMHRCYNVRKTFHITAGIFDSVKKKRFLQTRTASQLTSMSPIVAFSYLTQGAVSKHHGKTFATSPLQPQLLRALIISLSSRNRLRPISDMTNLCTTLQFLKVEQVGTFPCPLAKGITRNNNMTNPASLQEVITLVKLNQWHPHPIEWHSGLTHNK